MRCLSTAQVSVARRLRIEASRATVRRRRVHMWELRASRSSHICLSRSHIPPVFLLHHLLLLLLLIHGGEKGSFHLRIVILKGCNLCQRDFLFRVDNGTMVCPRVKLLLMLLWPWRPPDATSPILTFKAHLLLWLLLLLLLLLDGVLVRSLKQKVVRCQELALSVSIAVSVHISRTMPLYRFDQENIYTIRHLHVRQKRVLSEICLMCIVDEFFSNKTLSISGRQNI